MDHIKAIVYITVAALMLLAVIAVTSVFAPTCASADDGFYVRGDYSRPLGDDLEIVGAGGGYDFGWLRIEATGATAARVYHFEESLDIDEGFSGLLHLPAELGLDDVPVAETVSVHETLAFDYKVRANPYLVSAFIDGPEIWRVRPFAGYGVGIMTAEVEAPEIGRLKLYGALSRISAGLSLRITDRADAELRGDYYDGGLSQLDERLHFEFGAIGVGLRVRF